MFRIAAMVRPPPTPGVLFSDETFRIVVRLVPASNEDEALGRWLRETQGAHPGCAVSHVQVSGMSDGDGRSDPGGTESED